MPGADTARPAQIVLQHEGLRAGDRGEAKPGAAKNIPGPRQNATGPCRVPPSGPGNRPAGYSPSTTPAVIPENSNTSPPFSFRKASAASREAKGRISGPMGPRTELPAT